MRATFTRRVRSTMRATGESFPAEWDGKVWKRLDMGGTYTPAYAARVFDIRGVETPQQEEPHNQTETQDAVVMRVAANLLSEDGENSEYDRAIAEMTCDLLGINADDKTWVLRVLRAMRGTS